MTDKIRLGLLFGGRSGEHEVSLTSAASILRALDSTKYEIIPIGITHKGNWKIGTAAENLLPGGSAALPPDRLLPITYQARRASTQVPGSGLSQLARPMSFT